MKKIMLVLVRVYGSSGAHQGARRARFGNEMLVMLDPGTPPATTD